MHSIQGLLVEAILGPNRNSVNIKWKMELVLDVLENVFTVESSSDSEVQEFHTMPFIRLLASFINKAIKGNSCYLQYRCDLKFLNNKTM